MAVGDIPRVKRPYTAPLLERMPIESTANASAQNSDCEFDNISSTDENWTRFLG